MQVFGYVLLIIGLVLLFAFCIYEVVALIREIVKRVKNSKSKKVKSTDDNNAVDKTEKGND